MSKHVVMFIGPEDAINKARVPDDSLLIGWAGTPLERTPEFFIGPNGDTIHEVLDAARIDGWKCDQCGNMDTKPGYVFKPDDTCILAIAQCPNCGLFAWPESWDCVKAKLGGVQ